MHRHIPRVSVGLPIYNGQRYAAEAIDSILAQTFEDFELVICDNASTDRTAEICLAYAARDHRVQYYRNPENIGANRNFNRVAELVRRPIFAGRPTMTCVRRRSSNAASKYWTTIRQSSSATRKPSWSMATANHSPNPLAAGFWKTFPPMIRRGILILRPQAQCFFDMLMRTRWCFEIFGVSRREPLLRTGLQGSYYGADKVVLAALSLMGRFHEVPEELFLRRCHEGQSTSLRSASARATWSNPKSRRRVVVPQLECLRGYVDAVKHTALFVPERVACTFVLGRYLLQLGKIGLLLSN